MWRKVSPAVSKPAPARGRNAVEPPSYKASAPGIGSIPDINFLNFCGDPAAMADVAGIVVPLTDDWPASLGGEIWLAA